MSEHPQHLGCVIHHILWACLENANVFRVLLRGIRLERGGGRSGSSAKSIQSSFPMPLPLWGFTWACGKCVNFDAGAERKITKKYGAKGPERIGPGAGGATRNCSQGYPYRARQRCQRESRGRWSPIAAFIHSFSHSAHSKLIHTQFRGVGEGGRRSCHSLRGHGWLVNTKRAKRES